MRALAHVIIPLMNVYKLENISRWDTVLTFLYSSHLC